MRIQIVATKIALAALSLVIGERLDAAVRVRPGHDRVADSERAALDEHRRDEPAPNKSSHNWIDQPKTSASGLAFRPSTRGRRQEAPSRAGPSRFCSVFAETSANCVVPPQSSGWRSSCASSPFTVRVGAAGRSCSPPRRSAPRPPGVVDRFLRLRHHAVVGGDDEDGDVRHLRAAGAHRGEGFVARRVEEGDLVPSRRRPGRRRCAA